MAPGGSKKPPLDIPGETNPRESLNLAIEEISSLLLPEKERRYRSSRKRMKDKYYALEARYEQKREEVQLNFNSASSRKLEMMSSTLKKWRKVFSAHKQEHYARCSQLISNHTTEFDVFVAKYFESHFRLGKHSRMAQFSFRDTYLRLHNGSDALDTLPRPLRILTEIWGLSHELSLTRNLNTSSVNQLPTQDPLSKPPPSMAVRKSPGVISERTVDERERVRSTPTHSVSAPSRTTPLPMKDKPHPSTVPRGRDSPRVMYDAGKKDSTLESPNTPKRVQVTRTQECPSSLKPDSNPASRELQRSMPSKLIEPALARNLDSRRKLPSESLKKTASSVYHMPSKPNPSDKIRLPPVRELSVSVQKLPDKSAGVRVVGNSPKSPSRVVTAVVALRTPSPRAAPSSNNRTGNKTVSMKERRSAADYAPLAKTTPSLSKVSPVSSIRVNPPIQLKDELTLAPSWLPERCKPRVISTKSAVSKSTHILLDETRPRASRQAGNSPFSVPSIARGPTWHEKIIEAKGILPLLPEITKEQTSAHSSETVGLVSAPDYISSFSSELGEKRRDPNAVSNIHKECEETSSPNDTAALSLPIPVPAACALPPPTLFRSMVGPRPTGIEAVSKRYEAVVSVRENEENSSSNASTASTLSVPPPAVSWHPFAPASTRMPSVEFTPPAEVVQVQYNLNIISTRGIKDEEDSAPVLYARPRRSPDEVSPPVEAVLRQRNYNVVSTQRGSEESSSLDDVTVLALSSLVPVTSPVPSSPVVSVCAPSDELIPPSEVVPARRNQNVVSKSSMLSKVDSPFTRTARKQSKPLIAPSEPSEGKLPVKAVIHERPNKHAPISNDSVRQIPKVPLNRTTASKSNLRVGKTVSTTKLTSRTKDVPSAKEVSSVQKLSPVSSISAIPSSQLHAELNRPSSRISRRRESRKTRSKVPGPAVNLRAGKDLLAPAVKEPQQSIRTVETERNVPTPLEILKESVIERSPSTLGPVDIQAQFSLLPIELGEKRQVCDTTVISIQHRSEEASSPSVSVASTPLVAAPAASPVHPEQAELIHQLLNESKPPIEVVPSQHGLSVVKDRLTVSELHSRRHETVRRQSKPKKNPSEVSEGKYLASAAAYVRARISRRSLNNDEVVCRASNDPPDKVIESVSQRLSVSVVRKEIETSVNTCSPRLEPEEPESPLALSEAVPQRLDTQRAIKLSIRYLNLDPRHPESKMGISHVEVVGSCAEKLTESVNVEVSNEETSADSHSPGRCTIPSPAHTSAPADPEQAFSTPQLESSMLQLDRFPVQSSTEPDCINSSRRQVLDVVSGTVRIGESPHSPALRTVPASILSPASASPVLPLPTTQLNSALRQLVESSTQSSNRLDWSSRSRQYLCDVVSQSFKSSTTAYSPNFEAESTPPIPKHVDHSVNVPRRRESKELSRRVCCKPPDETVSSRRRNPIVVNTNVSPSVLKHSPSSWIARALSMPSPKTLWWAEIPDSTRAEYIWHVRRKPPDALVNRRRQSYGVVNKTNNIGDYDSPLPWAETMPPKSIILTLGNAPGLETSATDEPGHFLTHERPAEPPRLHHVHLARCWSSP